MKGIILAGGNGTRLHPVTKVVSKQLLPIYNKPMIYYPLCTLMKAGIHEILIISTPHDLPMYKELLGDGSHWNIKLSYTEQVEPDGLAQAFVLGEEFIGNSSVCLILGDNIFHGSTFNESVEEIVFRGSVFNITNATIFGYHVSDPQRYGVLKFEGDRVVSIIEKPTVPPSNYAVPGIYFFPNDVIEVAKQVKLSDRNEYEITSVINHYIDEDNLTVELCEEYAWLDTGTYESMLDASNYIKITEQRQGIEIGNPNNI